jgi:hypothetical protein
VKLRESVEVLNHTIDEEKILSSSLSKRLDNVYGGQMATKTEETAKKHNNLVQNSIFTSGQKSSNKIISSKNDDNSILEHTALTRHSSNN